MDFPNLRRLLREKNFRKWMRYTTLWIMLIHMVVVSWLSIGYFERYHTFKKQEQVMYEMISTRTDKDTMNEQKKMVSYLQGSATRQRNQIFEACIYFVIANISIAVMWRILEPMHGEYK